VQVFVSYTWTKNPKSSRVVNKFVKDLKTALSSKLPGSKVFQDIQGRLKNAKTDRIRTVLKKKLKKSDVLLILVSSDWLRSKWCRWEFDTFKNATNQTKPRIVPVKWWRLSAVSKNSTRAKELARLRRAASRNIRSGEKWSESASVRKIAKLAKKVVKNIPKEERSKAAGPETRRGSPEG
jgi:hypothetical protein